MTDQIVKSYHSDAIQLFRNYEKIAERLADYLDTESLLSAYYVFAGLNFLFGEDTLDKRF